MRDDEAAAPGQGDCAPGKAGRCNSDVTNDLEFGDIQCRPGGFTRRLSVRSAAGDRVIDPENDHGPDDGDDQAVDIQAGDPGRSEEAENHAADEGADDAKHDV